MENTRKLNIKLIYTITDQNTLLVYFCLERCSDLRGSDWRHLNRYIIPNIILYILMKHLDNPNKSTIQNICFSVGTALFGLARIYCIIFNAIVMYNSKSLSTTNIAIDINAR